MELNLIGHLLILFYCFLMIYCIEFFNRFEGVGFCEPSLCALIVFAFVEFLYWAIFLFFKFVIN